MAWPRFFAVRSYPKARSGQALPAALWEAGERHGPVVWGTLSPVSLLWVPGRRVVPTGPAPCLWWRLLRGASWTRRTGLQPQSGMSPPAARWRSAAALPARGRPARRCRAPRGGAERPVLPAADRAGSYLLLRSRHFYTRSQVTCVVTADISPSFSL